MKRILQILVITVTMLFASAVPSYAADCGVGIENVSVDGAVVTFDVYIENNPGLATGNVVLKYDNTVFEPQSVTRSGILSDVYLFLSNLDDDNTDITTIDQISVSWMNLSNISGDGTLFTCSFYIEDDFTSDQTITLETSQFANHDKEILTVTVEDGIIPVPTNDSDDDENDETSDFEVTVSQNTLTKSDMTVSGSVSATIYCYENASSAATVILGIYDSDDRLIGLKYEQKSLSTGINAIDFSNISASGNVQGSYYAKILAWDNLTNMTPLSDETLQLVIQ